LDRRGLLQGAADPRPDPRAVPRAGRHHPTELYSHIPSRRRTREASSPPPREEEGRWEGSLGLHEPLGMIREQIIKDLSSVIDTQVAAALVDSYEDLAASYARGDLDRCLTKAGLFVKHALRAIESIRTGVAPPEIKSVAATVRALEADTTLSDSLR